MRQVYPINQCGICRLSYLVVDHEIVRARGHKSESGKSYDVRASPWRADGYCSERCYGKR